jgi:hypothetical protein
MSSIVSLTESTSTNDNNDKVIESKQVTEQIDSKMKSITLKEEDTTIDDWEQLDQQVK